MNYRTKVSSYGGVYPIPLYTKTAVCGGSCIYCPKVKDLPASYVENEDTMYAKSVSFDPIKQFDRMASRIPSQSGRGMPMEIIILGGSFSSLSESYRMQYMSELYSHINQLYSSKNKRYLCSILTVESRPDQITKEECYFLRELGISKIEIGVQHTDDRILRIINRGHDIGSVIDATKLLKRNGFKVGYHIMLGLPGAQYEDDYLMLSKTLWSQSLSPDYLKIYPCELLSNWKYQPKLSALYRYDLWHPPDNEYIKLLLKESCKIMPRTVRISRIMRQFSDKSIVIPRERGLHEKLKNECMCIRCHEAGKLNVSYKDIEFDNCVIRQYDNSIDSCLQVLYKNALVALARVYKLNDECSILRELRVYGIARNLGTKGIIQGKGIGTRLLKYIESQAKNDRQERLLINAAIGAREFFINRGYSMRDDNYLCKVLVNEYDSPGEPADERALASPGRAGDSHTQRLAGMGVDGS